MNGRPGSLLELAQQDPRGFMRQLAGYLLQQLGELSAQGGMSAYDVARNSHVPDWIRWGDTKQIKIAAADATPSAAGQIVRVDYTRPTTWSLALVADFPDGLVGEGAGVFTIEFQVILGVGSSSVTLLRTAAVTVASLAASFNQVSFIDTNLPSKAISITAKLIPPVGGAVAAHQIAVSALACPIVE